MIHFARTELARELVTALRGKAVFSDAYNGLFLAAPRRTGKSTFLQLDLRPALEAAGIVVVYVDLWADQRRDPGELIADALGRALASRAGPLTRAARASGTETLTIAGMLKIDVARIGRMDGATLVDALRALHASAKAPVALIVDEAQQALTSEAGEAAMASLKSARDQLNQPGSINLMLVMSGSDRDKLLRLMNSSNAPFYGSQLSRMPPLGPEFIEHIAQLVAAQRPDLTEIDRGALLQAFEIFGHRPQFFMEALGQALSPLASLGDRSFEQAVLQAAYQRRQLEETQMASGYLGLRPLERAVLWRLLEQGPRFRPYDAEALRFYRQQVHGRVTVQMVQRAVESLREHNPSLVWKSARGEYTVDDVAMHRWFEECVRAGVWPPRDPDAIEDDRS